MDLSDAAGNLSIKATVSGDPAGARFTFKDATVAANLSGSALPGGKLVAAAKADIDLDLTEQVVNGRSLEVAVKNLKLLNGLRTTGNMTADTVFAQLGYGRYSASGGDVDLKALQLTHPKHLRRDTALYAPFRLQRDEAN